MTAVARRTAIVLAAGYGRRFGGDKQLARLADGTLVLEETLNRLRQATDDVLLVTRQNLLPSLQQALPGLEDRVRIVLSQDARLGMGHSLASGVAALATDCEGCLICLADMPWIAPQSYALLLDTLHNDGILIPAFEGRTGHPVGFGSRFFRELMQSHGDEGARRVIRRHPEACVRLSLPDPGILLDVDIPSDLERTQPD